MCCILVTNITISTYPETVKMNEYDVFILLSRGRFQENDKFILDEIEKREKPYFFARTHTDVDLQEFSYDNPEKFSKDTWKEEERKIKTKCYEKLGRHNKILKVLTNGKVRGSSFKSPIHFFNLNFRTVIFRRRSLILFR